MRNSDKFGRILIENVRDKSINHILRALDGGSVADKLLSQKLSAIPPGYHDVLENLAVHIVDDVIFNMLVIMEEECDILNITIVGDDGTTAPLTGQPDPLFDFFLGPDGWIAAFSKHPVSEFDRS